MSAPIGIALMFSPIVREIHPWYPAFLAASVGIVLACVAGLWMMKRWAAHLYAAFGGASQIVFFVMGAWHILAFLVPALTVWIVYRSAGEMT